MIRAVPATDSSFLLVGVVRGLRADVVPLVAELDRFRPRAVAIGLSPDEVKGLNEHFVGTDAEPLVPLVGNEAAEIRGLARFGEVQVPHPAYVAALEWAARVGVAAEAVDPTDEEFAELFAHHIGYFELVRRTVRERSLSRSPPEATSADEFVLEWDRRVGHGRGSLAFADARDRALVDALRRLKSRFGRVAGVVDRERFPGVLRAISEPVRALTESVPT